MNLNSPEEDRHHRHRNPFLSKMNTNSNIDDRKHCKCKKSECLKRYCDCFATGFYCDKHCSCQGCYNKPDYEDTVDMTREQIALRNPLAFSPKIHSLEYGDRLVGEHIKGCNCRKSMCQRKYCECYRAKVGCSDGCRCEGCRNGYGKKGEYNMRAIHNPDMKESVYRRLGLAELHSHSNSTPSAPLPYHVDNNPPPGYDDMMLGRQRGNIQHLNDEFMDQFTPPEDTNVNSMMNFASVNVMEWPNSSRAGGSSLMGAVTRPVCLFGGRAVTPVCSFGGNGNPINTLNNHSVPDAGSSTSSVGDK